MGKAVGEQELRDGDARASGSVYHHPAVLLFLADHFQGVDDACENHDSGAVLVIMKDRDVEKPFQSFLDLKAPGSADILQVDASEARGKISDGLDDFLRILSVQTDGNRIDTSEFLKKHGFSLHHGHGGVGTDISKPEDGAAVGDHGHRVGLHGIGVGGLFVPGDDLTGLRHAGRVGQSQILPGLYRGFGDGFQFAVPFFVKHKSVFIRGHIYPPFYLKYCFVRHA